MIRVNCSVFRLFLILCLALVFGSMVEQVSSVQIEISSPSTHNQQQPREDKDYGLDFKDVTPANVTKSGAKDGVRRREKRSIDAKYVVFDVTDERETCGDAKIASTTHICPKAADDSCEFSMSYKIRKEETWTTETKVSAGIEFKGLKVGVEVSTGHSVTHEASTAHTGVYTIRPGQAIYLTFRPKLIKVTGVATYYKKKVLPSNAVMKEITNLTYPVKNPSGELDGWLHPVIYDNDSGHGQQSNTNFVCREVIKELPKRGYDRYGRKCMSPCKNKATSKYWCYFAIKLSSKKKCWEYCSNSPDRTIRAKPCKGVCQKKRKSYFWCKSGRSWDYCARRE